MMTQIYMVLVCSGHRFLVYIFLLFAMLSFHVKIVNVSFMLFYVI